MAKRVGIIGCGAIGSSIANAIDKGVVQGIELLVLFDQIVEKAEALSSQLKRRAEVAKTFEELMNDGLDLIVEAASQKAVKDYAIKILNGGVDLMIMSTGALLDKVLWEEINRACERRGRRVFVPSGAIAGIDGLRTAKLDIIHEVILTTKKSPKALAGAPFFDKASIKPEDIHKEKLLFEGTAQDAVKLFPTNINVAATLSLAGIGGSKTRVRVIADPKLDINIHEFEVKGSFGSMKVIMKNLPHPENPKTSYIAVLSAIETLRSALSSEARVGT